MVQHVYNMTFLLEPPRKLLSRTDENQKKKQWTFKRCLITLLVPQMKWAEQPIIETKLSMHAPFEAALNLYQDMKT